MIGTQGLCWVLSDKCGKEDCHLVAKSFKAKKIKNKKVGIKLLTMPGMVAHIYNPSHKDC